MALASSRLFNGMTQQIYQENPKTKDPKSKRWGALVVLMMKKWGKYKFY